MNFGQPDPTPSINPFIYWALFLINNSGIKLDCCRPYSKFTPAHITGWKLLLVWIFCYRIPLLTTTSIPGWQHSCGRSGPNKYFWMEYTLPKHMRRPYVYTVEFTEHWQEGEACYNGGMSYARFSYEYNKSGWSEQYYKDSLKNCEKSLRHKVSRGNQGLLMEIYQFLSTPWW